MKLLNTLCYWDFPYRKFFSRRLEKVAPYRAIKLLRILWELHMLTTFIFKIKWKRCSCPTHASASWKVCAPKFVQFSKRKQEKFSTLNPVVGRSGRKKSFHQISAPKSKKVILIPKENIWFRVKYCYENGIEARRKKGKTSPSRQSYEFDFEELLSF